MPGRHANQARQEAEEAIWRLAVGSPRIDNARRERTGAVIDDTNASDAVVTLRNGATCQAGWARTIYHSLQRLLAADESRFRTFGDLVDGKLPRVDPQSVVVLRQYGLLTAEGQPNQIARDVFHSSRRETPDGLMLVDPFSPASPDEAAAIRKAEQQADERLGRLGRSLGNSDEPRER